MYIIGTKGESGNPTDSVWIIKKIDKYTKENIWETTSNPSSWDDQPICISLDSNYIYIGGEVQYYFTNRFLRIEKRRKVDGELIYYFNSPFSSTTYIGDCIVDENYIYTVGGVEQWNGRDAWFIAKFKKDNLNLEWSKVYDFSDFDDGASSLTQDSNYLYVGGYDSSLGQLNTQWRILVISKNDGNIIRNITRNPSNALGQDDWITDIYYDNGYLYVLGSYVDNNYYGWRLEKMATSGTSLWVKNINPTPGWDYPTDLVLDNNYIYLSGVEYMNSFSNRRYRIEKRSKNGDLLYFVLGNPVQDINAMDVDDSILYIGGKENLQSENWQWLIQAIVK